MNTKVSVAGCADYNIDAVRQALEEVLKPFGGLDWVEKGMRISVKVNLLGPFRPKAAATTHPAPVCALCEMLCERGAKVVVGDSPGGLYAKAYLAPIYKTTGMTRVTSYGARLNDDFGTLDVAFGEAVQMKNFRMTKYLAEADAVINFSKLKTHGLMAYTGACKNMYGAIPGMLKSEYHYLYPTPTAFADMLVDINSYIKPALSIQDAVWTMEGNGPANGTPRFMGALIASENPHALDLAAAAMIGLSPRDVPTLAAAIRRGLIPDRCEALDICGNIEKYRAPGFKTIPVRDVTHLGTDNGLVASVLKRLLASYPLVDKGLCTGCKKCGAHCPADAIVFVNGRPRIDRRACVRCFCCQEFCPAGAVTVCRPPAARLLNR